MHKSVEINITDFNTVAGALTNPNTQTSEATHRKARHITTTQLDTLAIPKALWFVLPI